MILEVRLALVCIKSKHCCRQTLILDFNLIRVGKDAQVSEDLGRHIQYITVASLSIVNVNKPLQTHPVCL